MSNLRNPSVPFNVPIPGGMTSGKVIVVQGKIPSMSHSFAVNLLTRSGDIALHISPKFKENRIVRNNLLNNNWGPEESHGSMPMRTGQLFEIYIVCESYNFKIEFNESPFCEFSHRLPFNTISNLAVEGDVLVHHVNFKDSNGSGNNNDSYGLQPGSSSKNYQPSTLYPTVDPLDFPSVPTSRRSPSPSVPQYPGSGGPIYPTPNAPPYPSGGSAYPGAGGFQYPSHNNSYPGNNGPQYPPAGNTYPSPGGFQYPSGGNIYPGPGGNTYPSAGGNTYPSTGGNTYPGTGGNSYPGSGGSHNPSGGRSSSPQKHSLYPTQPGYPSNPYPQLPSQHGGTTPTPHSKPGFLDQAGAALAGVLGPTLLAGGMNRGSATHGKPNLLDEAGRALAGVIGGAGLAGTGKSVKGTQPHSPTHQSGFLDQAGTALAGILGGAGLMGAMGRPQTGTSGPNQTRHTQPGSILDQAGSALAGILGGSGLAGAGVGSFLHHNRKKLGTLGGVLGTAVAGAALTGHLNPIKATKKQLKAHKKALKYGLPIAGMGIGAYALHKGLKKGFRRSSSSSSCSSSD